MERTGLFDVSNSLDIVEGVDLFGFYGPSDYSNLLHLLIDVHTSDFATLHNFGEATQVLIVNRD